MPDALYRRVWSVRKAAEGWMPEDCFDYVQVPSGDVSEPYDALLERIARLEVEVQRMNDTRLSYSARYKAPHANTRHRTPEPSRSVETQPTIITPDLPALPPKATPDETHLF